MIIILMIMDRSLFKCRGGGGGVGGRLKIRVEGHVNFSLASRGLPFYFDFRVGGSC